MSCSFEPGRRLTFLPPVAATFAEEGNMSIIGKVALVTGARMIFVLEQPARDYRGVEDKRHQYLCPSRRADNSQQSRGPRPAGTSTAG
jgi:hypothetical protein